MNNSNRILIFLLGLSLGLLGGAGFFIFKIDTYITQLVKSKKDTIIALTETGKNTGNIGSSVSLKTAKVAATTRDSMYKPVNPQLIISYDTINGDSTSALKADDLVVRTDELMAIKTLEVRNLTEPERNSTTRKTDSLIQALSGIRDDSKLFISNYKIEFWRSPLNYRGFKMTKNRLLLFGINVYDDIKLYKLDENIYLKAQQEIYKLDYTSDFRHFEAIKDPVLTSKIQQDNLFLQQ